MKLIRDYLRYRRQKAACDRLNRLVEANRRAAATRDYREHRAAALKHYRAR